MDPGRTSPGPEATLLGAESEPHSGRWGAMDILEATLDSSGLSHPPWNISGQRGRRVGQVESLQERDTPTKRGGSWW